MGASVITELRNAVATNGATYPGVEISLITKGEANDS
jgi:hypothetical protein